MKKFNIKEHILDHADLVNDSLSEMFDVNKRQTFLHFKISIDRAQMIQKGYDSQEKIDAAMKVLFDKLKTSTYTYHRNKGDGRVEETTLELAKNVLMAYHNESATAIQNRNDTEYIYEPEPHLHFLLEKHNGTKNIYWGKDYLYLIRMLHKTASELDIPLVFHTVEKIPGQKQKTNKDLDLNKRVEQFSWTIQSAKKQDLIKYSKSDWFKKKLDEAREKYIKDENLTYYLKILSNLQYRLKESNISVMYQGVDLKDEFPPLYLSYRQKNQIDTLKNGTRDEIIEMFKDRSNRICRSLLTVSAGFEELSIQILEKHYNIKLPLLSEDIIKDINPTYYINPKYKTYTHDNKFIDAVKADFKYLLSYVKNETELKEQLHSLGYLNPKMKAKTIDGVRQRVGITFDNIFPQEHHKSKRDVIYFDRLGFDQKYMFSKFQENKNNESINSNSMYISSLKSYVPVIDNTLDILKKKQEELEQYQYYIFKKIYNTKHKLKSNLDGFYIYEDVNGKVELFKQGVYILDDNNKLTVKHLSDNNELKNAVAIILDQAKSKDFDMDNIKVTGTLKFQNEVKRQLEILKDEEIKESINNIEHDEFILNNIDLETKNNKKSYQEETH